MKILTFFKQGYIRVDCLSKRISSKHFVKVFEATEDACKVLNETNRNLIYRTIIEHINLTENNALRQCPYPVVSKFEIKLKSKL